jgi:hypothetical protein
MIELLKMNEIHTTKQAELQGEELQGCKLMLMAQLLQHFKAEWSTCWQGSTTVQEYRGRLSGYHCTHRQQQSSLSTTLKR